MPPSPAENPAVMEAIQQLFDNLSPEDKLSFLARSSAFPAPECIAAQNPTAMQAESVHGGDSPSANQAGLISTTAAKRRRLLKLKERKHKKPLNAFIAYRSYYSPILSGLTQKAKSGIVQQMWAHENRKHLFALLGQAYSELRDSNRAVSLDKESLKKFLSVVVKLLPIIPAEDYLSVMGWVRGVENDGAVTLKKPDNVAATSEYPMHTNLSAQDIVNHCYNIGLASRSTDNASSPGLNAGGAMAFAAAPSMTSALRRQLWPSVENPDDDDELIADSPAAETMPAASTGMQTAPEFDFSGDLNTSYPPTIAQVTADQQRAFNMIPIPMHFHPAMQPPLLGFDPSLVQDDFDPYNFDVNRYLNLDFKI